MKYLKNLILHNVGPIADVKLAAEFTDAGEPKPIVLIGKNGAGKSVAISTIVDALHEFASQAGFEDINRPNPAGGRYYYRIGGGALRRIDSDRYISAVEFSDPQSVVPVEQKPWLYFDKSGEFTEVDWKNILGENFRYPGPGQDNSKLAIADTGAKFKTVNEEVKVIYRENSYCFFPPNRGEKPFWLNTNSERELPTDGTEIMSNRLGKPIVCSTPVESSVVWLMDSILDDLARGHAAKINFLQTEKMKLNSGHAFSRDEMLPILSLESLEIFEAANQILSVALGEPAQFLIHSRTSYKRLNYAMLNSPRLGGLHVSHLSHGQSSLIGIFCTILRYSDTHKFTKLSEIQGVAIIDEADAGLHVSHQHEILPKLMKLMPRVQFILTTHSPLVLLGLEREYGKENVQIVELPSGRSCSSDDFLELGAALQAYQASQTYKNQIQSLIIKETTKPIVYIEGVSDEIILKTAWQKLRDSEFPFHVEGKVNSKHLELILQQYAHSDPAISRPVMAIWDFDDAVNNWKGSLGGKSPYYVKDEAYSEADGLVVKAKNGKSIFGVLLPVPDERKGQAQLEFPNSYFTIELYFSDEVLKNNLNTCQLAGGGSYKSFRGDKISFANGVAALDKSAFQNFEPLFQLMDKLLRTD